MPDNRKIYLQNLNFVLKIKNLKTKNYQMMLSKVVSRLKSLFQFD